MKTHLIPLLLALTLSGSAYAGPWPFGPWGPMTPEVPPHLAGIDCDISPEEAEVWVDGRRIGEADDYDGFPRLLILEPGKRRIEFRHRGYRTISIDVDLRPGWLLRLDDEMERGDPTDVKRHRSAPPTAQRTTERRERYREPSSRYQESERYEREAPRERYEEPYRERYEDDPWEEERYRESEEEELYQEDPYQEESRYESSGGYEANGNIERPGWIRFDVDPSDAHVYVDGDYHGRVSEIRRQGGLELAAGDHWVVLTRDGYEPREMHISVSAGTSSEVNAELLRTLSS